MALLWYPQRLLEPLAVVDNTAQDLWGLEYRELTKEVKRVGHSPWWPDCCYLVQQFEV